MKRKLIGLFIIMLFIITISLPAFATINKEEIYNEEKTVNNYINSESLIHPEIAFLFGRIHNKHSGGIGWTCDAIDLRIFNFAQLEYNRYTNYETLEVGKPGLGIFTNRFITGFYMIM